MEPIILSLKDKKTKMYEYKILSSDTPISENQLNELDSDGWELANILFYNDSYITYLRRMKEKH